jgi:hypothetical protein
VGPQVKPEIGTARQTQRSIDIFEPKKYEVRGESIVKFISNSNLYLVLLLGI